MPENNDDAIQLMLESIEEQAKKIAEAIKKLNVQVGATNSEDKTFEHFIKWGTESVKIAENIMKLKSMIKGEPAESAEPTGRTPLEKFNAGKH